MLLSRTFRGRVPTALGRRWSRSDAVQRRRVPTRRSVAWAVALGSLGGIGLVGYEIWSLRHPPEVQYSADPSKKTLVILGSGWGSTSLLKDLDSENYNVVVVSPRNYFLFTPLLPSTATGTVESRSIIQPIRQITRHKKTAVSFYESECTEIDPTAKIVTVTDVSPIKGEVLQSTIPYDYLVIGIGAENSTFGIPGVKENACFLKEIWDANKIRQRIIDCIETATLLNQTPEEKDRLLHMVVVGGGPTGIEFAAELHDFFEDDLKQWYPEISDRFRITLVEALPNVLPSFSKSLISYTEKMFKKSKIDIHTGTMVKEVNEKQIVAQIKNEDGTMKKASIPYGLLVWATGNGPRSVVKNLMRKVPAQATARRGLLMDEYLLVHGVEGIWALGDATDSKYAPTAQVASQQGKYLSRLFNVMARLETLETEIADLQDRNITGPELEKKVRALNRVKLMKPFEYSNQGSLAYIGNNQAIADLPFGSGEIALGGVATYYFWRSVYLNKLFSIRNRSLVLLDWIKVRILGRDISRA